LGHWRRLRTFATQFCDFEENFSKKGLERLLDLKTIPLCSASAQTNHREDYSAISRTRSTLTDLKMTERQSRMTALGMGSYNPRLSCPPFVLAEGWQDSPSIPLGVLQ